MTASSHRVSPARQRIVLPYPLGDRAEGCHIAAILLPAHEMRPSYAADGPTSYANQLMLHHQFVESFEDTVTVFVQKLVVCVYCLVL